MMRDVFVGTDLNILEGDRAKRALARDNDAPFLSEHAGIAAVSKERWQKAQTAERTHWMVRGVHCHEDRNYLHKANFDHYSSVRGMRFDRALEIGCGPFTNLRLIGSVCRIRACVLLDPLIADYLAHPHVNYNKRYLCGGSPYAEWLSRVFSADSSPPFVDRVLSHTAGRLPSRIRHAVCLRRIPVQQLIAEPIESYEPKAKFNLVVMINVLEHCFDARRIFDTLARIVEKDGILVFHDKYYEHESVAERSLSIYDAAHPLKVDKKVMDQFLHGSFRQIFARTVPVRVPAICVAEGRQDSLYFIGRRL